MITEHIEHMDELPIKISVSSIEEYPIHNHNEHEVIYILEGEIDLKLFYYTYHLKQGNIFVIHGGDLHSIYKKSDSNLILFLQIDMEKYKKVHPLIHKIIFANDTYSNKKTREATDKIKHYLAQMVYESSHKKSGYKESIEVSVINCLLCLINNFLGVSVDEDKKFINQNKFSKDKLQIERIQRIMIYVYDNYNKKINLEQIAKEEHISKFYLTRLLKEGFGYGFQDFINMARIERSEVLLLGTDKKIDDIAFECGFSSYNYFNKHFQHFFDMTPSKYRKQFKNKTIAVRKIKLIKYDETRAMQRIKDIIKTPKDINRWDDSQETLNVVEVDFSSNESQPFDHYWKYLNLLNIDQGLTMEYQKHLEKCQNEVGFEFIRLNFNSFIEKYTMTANWEWLSQFIDMLYKIEMVPIITIDYEALVNGKSLYQFTDVFRKFLVFCINKFGQEKMKLWQIEVHRRLKDNEFNDFIEEIRKIIKPHKMNTPKEKIGNDYYVNPLYDTEFMPGYILNKILNHKASFKDGVFLVDGINDYSKYESFFHGGSGLIAMNGLTKASYYAFYLLSKLGNEIIAKSDGYIVTKKNDNFQILIYNFHEICSEWFINKKIQLIQLEEVKKQLNDLVNTKKEYIFKLRNIYDKYTIKKFKIDGKNGYEYKHWADMGFPQSISKEDEALIQRISFPQITFSHIEEKNYHDLFVALEPFNVELIMLEKKIV